ncbi:PilZ domain-containing protein [Sphingobium sp. CAP-1]|uniref:PilZ domain-containing protein n=1 Tax=Sphingobium sp. CAP-1 TaxID=2676077 RepID=UPI0012BB2A57|nr:PilZ domain-containing protein [Sphingobium sp. CAP-1]QGP78229.1 hypothetical protein GL174_03895 [Sphingobium sp. CAP-1]
MAIDTLATYFERRHHPRFVTAFEAELLDGEAVRTVIVGDISAGGCLLEHPQGFARGHKMHLRARALDMASHVMWTQGDLCGLRFARIVDPHHVIQANMNILPSLRLLMAGVGLRQVDDAG